MAAPVTGAGMAAEYGCPADPYGLNNPFLPDGNFMLELIGIEIAVEDIRQLDLGPNSLRFMIVCPVGHASHGMCDRYPICILLVVL